MIPILDDFKMTIQYERNEPLTKFTDVESQMKKQLVEPVKISEKVKNIIKKEEIEQIEIQDKDSSKKKIQKQPFVEEQKKVKVIPSKLAGNDNYNQILEEQKEEDAPVEPLNPKKEASKVIQDNMDAPSIKKDQE